MVVNYEFVIVILDFWTVISIFGVGLLYLAPTLASCVKLGYPIYKPDGHPKPDRFGSEISPMGVCVIFHPSHFCHGSGFCFT
jgi:hypothetical protein